MHPSQYDDVSKQYARMLDTNLLQITVEGTYQLSHIYDKLLLPLRTSSREQSFRRRQQLLSKRQ